MNGLGRYSSIRALASTLMCVAFVLPALSARAFDEDHKEKINGTTLHFRVRGADKNNPYLLILHGGPGFSAHMFYPWGPSLEKTLNVVYLDQRGCGESEHFRQRDPLSAPTTDDFKDFTISNMIQDLEGVRTYLKIGRWYVLGHSWGGMLGLEYVIANPGHVAGFIDMDGVLSFPKVQDAIFNNSEAKFNQQAASGDAQQKARANLYLKQIKSLRALPETNPERLFGAFYLAMGPAGLYFAGDQSKLYPAFLKSIKEAVEPYHVPPADLSMTPDPMRGLIANDHLLTRDDTPLLGRVRVPTLIINGKQDGVATPEMAETAHREIHNSELLLLDDCGHFPFVEQPEKTTTAILDFVRSHHA